MLGGSAVVSKTDRCPAFLTFPLGGDRKEVDQQTNQWDDSSELCPLEKIRQREGLSSSGTAPGGWSGEATLSR